MKYRALVLAMAMGIGTLPAMAADFTDQNVEGGPQCLRTFHSPILDLPKDQIAADVNGKYGHALEVSEERSVIYDRSQLFTWASEAKVSCAKAVGFLKSGEVNVEQISQCDCFYSRMRVLMR
ncbi:MAG: hypothetical protein ACR2OM_13800 [Aestuariivirgaceae bacterium]